MTILYIRARNLANIYSKSDFHLDPRHHALLERVSRRVTNEEGVDDDGGFYNRYSGETCLSRISVVTKALTNLTDKMTQRLSCYHGVVFPL